MVRKEEDAKTEIRRPLHDSSIFKGSFVLTFAGVIVIVITRFAYYYLNPYGISSLPLWQGAMWLMLFGQLFIITGVAIFVYWLFLYLSQTSTSNPIISSALAIGIAAVLLVIFLVFI